MPYSNSVIFGQLPEQGLSSIVILWTLRRMFADEGETCCIECAFGGHREQQGVELFNALTDLFEDFKNNADRKPFLLAPSSKNLSLDEAFLLAACEATQAADLERAERFLSAFLGRRAFGEELENLRLLGWCFLLRGQLINAPGIARAYQPVSKSK